MRRIVPAALLCAGLAALPSLYAAAPAAPPPAAPKGDKAEDRFKNIQVFKGLPADQLMPAMQFMTAALGADCELCHVERAFEKDDKREKGIARKMIAMTQGLQRDAFGGRPDVTCWSCHRGQEAPQVVPALDVAHREGDEAPAAPLDAPAAPILAHFLAASGGAEALAKINSRVAKGNLSGFGPQAMPVEIYAEAPDRRVSIVRTPRGESITGYDGKAGWLGGGGRPPREMSPAESEAARFDAELRLPARLGQLFDRLHCGPDATIDGKKALQVIGERAGQPPVELYFDAQSGLLLRTVRYAETPLGRLPTQVDYADYRAADGVTVPYRWSVSRPGSRFEIMLESLTNNVPIEADRFRH